jgi:hypothetical protein
MYYTPGMISLAFLALLFTGLLLRYHRLQNYHVLEVNMFPDPTRKHQGSFKRLHFEIPRRNYRTIALTGDLRTDRAKLDTFQLQLRGLLLRKDTVNGLHLLFEDKARYESYVRAFNVCLIEKASVYLPRKNHLWLLYFERSRDQYPPTVCGTSALRDEAVAQSDWNGKDKATRRRFWQGATQAFAGPLLLGVVLLVGSMIQIVTGLSQKWSSRH